MPSPFPGMDPYLENPAWWANVHHGLISEMQANLNRQLHPRYHADVEERVYLSDTADAPVSSIVPDVHIIARPSRIQTGPAAGGTAATIEPIEVTPLIEEEIREAFLQIVDARDHAVVAVIEVLSPANKLNGSTGRQSYLRKRREVLISTSHLVEIDLLRAGARTYFKEKTPQSEYLVHVSRSVGMDDRKSLMWAIPLSQPLPAISIPLKKGDADAQVQLQQLVDSVYERGSFDLKIDYTRDPVPPLDAEQSAWAKQILAGKLA